MTAKETLICFGYVRSSLPTIQIDDIANVIFKYSINDEFGFIHNKRYTQVYNPHGNILCNMNNNIKHDMSTVIFKPFLSSLLCIHNPWSIIKLIELNITICKLPEKCKLKRLGINSYEIEFGLLCIPKQSILNTVNVVNTTYLNEKHPKCSNSSHSSLNKLNAHVIKKKNINANSVVKYESDYAIKCKKYLNEFDNIFSNKINYFAMDTCRLGLLYRNILNAKTTYGHRVYETAFSKIDLNMFKFIKSIYVGCTKTAKTYSCFFKDNNSDRQKPKDRFIYHFKQKYDARYCLKVDDFVQIAVKLDENNDEGKKYKIYFGKGIANAKNETNMSKFKRNINFGNTSDFLDGCACDVKLNFDEYDYLFALSSARCSCDSQHKSVGYEICLQKYYSNLIHPIKCT